MFELTADVVVHNRIEDETVTCSLHPSRLSRINHLGLYAGGVQRLDEEARARLEESWERLSELMASPLRVNISAKTGRGLEKIWPAVEKVLAAAEARLGTAELNRILAKSLRRHRPPAERGRPWKLYYATQVGTSPPRFMLFANRTLAKGSTYRRYLENALRKTQDWPGIPVRLSVRKRSD